TMALWQGEDPCEYGIVGLSGSPGGEVNGELKEGYISRFKEKPTPEEAFSNVINAGLYIIEPEVLQMVPEGEKYDFSKQLFPRVLELGMPMYAKTVEGIWYDVGHPLELLNAQRALIEMRDSLPFPMPEGEVLSDGSFIAKGSTVSGEIERSVILSNCNVSSKSSVKNSLVMSGCNIDGNIIGSVIGESCIIIDSDLSAMVIGDQQDIQSKKLTNHRLPAESQ
ncbi:MAG: nucleotidyltransferase family protein, partial [Candidatus Poseidoniales archaeon]